MRRILAALFFVILTSSAFAKEGKISDVYINLELDSLGGGTIVERWDATVTNGTEFYLVKNNLRDIVISDLVVKDETGRIYDNRNPWISKGLDMEEKIGKCGIVKTDEGNEICWGLGSYGHHVYTVSYRMTNMVRTLKDADILHFQFISSEMSSAPEHAKVQISFPGDCYEVLGFGYKGNCYIEGSKIIAETTSEMDRDNSVIVLAKFPVGTFKTLRTEEANYEEVLEEAKKEDMTGIIVLSITLLIIISIIPIVAIEQLKIRKSVTGISRMNDIEPSRNIPFNGDILKSWYVLTKTWQTADYTSALLLKFIRDGYVKLNDKHEFVFPKVDTSHLYRVDRVFLEFMEKASGKDNILQKREFKKWAMLHTGKLDKWNATIEKEAKSALTEDGTIDDKGKFTSIGQERALAVLANYKYIKLSGIKELPENCKIDDNMIFSALNGFSEKLMTMYRHDPSYMQLYHMMLLNHRISSATSSGGNVSVSGGGGFSGGGAGGGCR